MELKKSLLQDYKKISAPEIWCAYYFFDPPFDPPNCLKLVEINRN